MTFKYGLTLAAHGPNKLRRFNNWAANHLPPDLAYRLPPQTPIATQTMTIRLRSREDAERLLAVYPETLP